MIADPVALAGGALDHRLHPGGREFPALDKEYRSRLQPRQLIQDAVRENGAGAIVECQENPVRECSRLVVVRELQGQWDSSV